MRSLVLTACLPFLLTCFWREVCNMTSANGAHCAHHPAEPRSPRRTKSGKHINGVLIRGINHLGIDEISRRLASFNPEFDRGYSKIFTLKSKQGILFKHRLCHELVGNAPNNLFGPNIPFKIETYRPAPQAHCPILPKNLTNDELLSIIPGAFKISRYGKSPGGRVYFTDQTALAINIRDRVKAGNQLITFEVPFHKECSRCLGIGHKTKDCIYEPVCRQCGECHEPNNCNTTCCAYCKSTEHSIKRCPEMLAEKRRIQSIETQKLLRTICTVEEIDNGLQDTVRLSSHQTRVIQESKQSVCNLTSYANVASQRLHKIQKTKKRNSKDSNSSK